MKSKLVVSLLLVLYVEFLPYACRLPRGVDWVKQYLPDEGMLFFGLLFFSAFAAVAVVPLILGYWFKDKFPWANRVGFALVSLMLIYLHKDYDMASDAQAALALLFFPIYTAILGSVAWALVAGSEWVTPRNAGPEDFR